MKIIRNFEDLKDLFTEISELGDLVKNIVNTIKQKIRLLTELNLTPSYHAPLFTAPEVYKYDERIRKMLERRLFSRLEPVSLILSTEVAKDLSIGSHELRIDLVPTKDVYYRIDLENGNFIYIDERSLQRRPELKSDAKPFNVNSLLMYISIMIENFLPGFPDFEFKLNILSLIYWCYSLGFDKEINKLLDKFLEIIESGRVDLFGNYIKDTIDYVVNTLGPEIWNRFFALLRFLTSRRDLV